MFKRIHNHFAKNGRPRAAPQQPPGDRDERDTLLRSDMPTAKSIDYRRADIKTKHQAKMYFLEIIETLQLDRGDGNEEVDFDLLYERFRHDKLTDPTLDGMSVLITKTKTPLEKANRFKTYGNSLTDNVETNKRRIKDEKHKLAWLPKRFKATHHIDETQLISHPTLFGRQGEKLYLHYVAVAEEEEMMCLLLQRRNGQGDTNLRDRKRCDYVRAYKAGKHQHVPPGILPVIYLYGRDVPDNLTLCLRPVWMEYREFMGVAKGGVVKSSEALINIYVRASNADYVERHEARAELSEEVMANARKLIERRVGNIEEYFKSDGTMTLKEQRDASVVGASGSNMYSLREGVGSQVFRQRNYINPGEGETDLTGMVGNSNLNEAGAYEEAPDDYDEEYESRAAPNRTAEDPELHNEDGESDQPNDQRIGDAHVSHAAHDYDEDCTSEVGEVPPGAPAAPAADTTQKRTAEEAQIDVDGDGGNEAKHPRTGGGLGRLTRDDYDV